MTTIARVQDAGVPVDSFAIRLAIVRAVAGWNYDQAARATGISSETWRLWEKRKRRCTNLEETCRVIAAATGLSFEWLMIGGPLAEPSFDPGLRAVGSAITTRFSGTPSSRAEMSEAATRRGIRGRLRIVRAA